MTMNDVCLISKYFQKERTTIRSIINIANLQQYAGIDGASINDNGKKFKFMDTNGDTVMIKRCKGVNECIDFLRGEGIFPDTPNTLYKIVGKTVTDFLRERLPKDYEKIGKDGFRAGEVYKHDSNSKEYFLINIVDTHEKSVDALLMDTKSFEIMYASGLSMYKVSFPDDRQHLLDYTGCSWSQGRYFGTINKNTNLQHIMADLPISEEKQVPKTIYQARDELVKEYINTSDILKMNYDKELKEVAAKVMDEKFDGLEFNDFMRKVDYGEFDHLIKDNTKIKGGEQR